jgi:hypothetical protein
MIEVSATSLYAETLDTTGIAPKKRSVQGCLYMLGGLQIFLGNEAALCTNSDTKYSDRFISAPRTDSRESS